MYRAEVGELEDDVLCVRVPEEEQVLGLDVPVDESVRMAGLERAKQLAPESARAGLGEGAIAVQALQQVAARPLHDEPACKRVVRAWSEGRVCMPWSGAMCRAQLQAAVGAVGITLVVLWWHSVATWREHSTR